MSQFNFNQRCEELLADYKRRDGNRVAQRLEEIRGALGRAGYGMVQTKFGGSVKRGTYVTGLSDVDALLIVNQTGLDTQPPSEAIEHVRRVIQSHFRDTDVTPGKLAVTIEFANGPELQILPAIRTSSNGIRIAEPGSSNWSNITRPEKLIEVNNANGGRVVPVIKLTKAMADCHVSRPSRKISGYHIESLAIDAFSGYEGKLKTQIMLDHFLTYSMDAVMEPIADSTGQSRFVDEYLCNAGSALRERAKTYFGQIRGEVRRCNTRAQFNKLFGL